MPIDRGATSYSVQLRPPGKAAQPVDVTSRVLTFEYEDDEKKADALKITVNNQDLQMFDDPLWRKGNILTVTWGYPGVGAPARDVVIQKITGFTTLTVEALGKGVLMNKRSKSRHFDNMTRAQVVRQVAQENGYGAALVDVQDTGVVHPTILQANLTDAQFIKRLAHLEGFEFFVDFDGLHFHERRLGQRPLRVLTWYTPPMVGEIIDMTVENDVTGKPGAVTLAGRDPLAKRDVRQTADGEQTKREALAPVQEASVDPVTGQLTFSTANVATEARHTSEVGDAAAKREADGAYKRAQNVAVKLRATIVGDPRLPAKSVVELAGLGKRLSGKYYLQSVKHSISSGGYLCTITAHSNGSGGTHADKATPSAASLNKQQPEGDADKLSQTLVVDGETGATNVVYRDTSGRTTEGTR